MYKYSVCTTQPNALKGNKAQVITIVRRAQLTYPRYVLIDTSTKDNLQQNR